jgi:hypothetical protein
MYPSKIGANTFEMSSSGMVFLSFLLFMTLRVDRVLVLHDA